MNTKATLDGEISFIFLRVFYFFPHVPGPPIAGHAKAISTTKSPQTQPEKEISSISTHTSNPPAIAGAVSFAATLATCTGIILLVFNRRQRHRGTRTEDGGGQQKTTSFGKLPRW